MTMASMCDDEYADCPDCEYDENDYVKVQCEGCRKSVDAIIDHLVAARASLRRGVAMIVGKQRYRLKATTSRAYNIPPAQDFVCFMADVSMPYGKFQWESEGQTHTRSVWWCDVEAVPSSASR